MLSVCITMHCCNACLSLGNVLLCKALEGIQSLYTS